MTATTTPIITSAATTSSQWPRNPFENIITTDEEANDSTTASRLRTMWMRELPSTSQHVALCAGASSLERLFANKRLETMFWKISTHLSRTECRATEKRSSSTNEYSFANQFEKEPLLPMAIMRDRQLFIISDDDYNICLYYVFQKNNSDQWHTDKQTGEESLTFVSIAEQWRPVNEFVEIIHPKDYVMPEEIERYTVARPLNAIRWSNDRPSPINMFKNNKFALERGQRLVYDLALRSVMLKGEPKLLKLVKLPTRKGWYKLYVITATLLCDPTATSASAERVEIEKYVGILRPLSSLLDTLQLDCFVRRDIPTTATHLHQHSECVEYSSLTITNIFRGRNRRMITSISRLYRTLMRCSKTLYRSLARSDFFLYMVQQNIIDYTTQVSLASPNKMRLLPLSTDYHIMCPSILELMRDKSMVILSQFGTAYRYLVYCYYNALVRCCDSIMRGQDNRYAIKLATVQASLRSASINAATDEYKKSLISPMLFARHNPKSIIDYSAELKKQNLRLHQALVEILGCRSLEELVIKRYSHTTLCSAWEAFMARAENAKHSTTIQIDALLDSIRQSPTMNNNNNNDISV